MLVLRGSSDCEDFVPSPRPALQKLRTGLGIRSTDHSPTYSPGSHFVKLVYAICTLWQLRILGISQFGTLRHWVQVVYGQEPGICRLSLPPTPDTYLGNSSCSATSKISCCALRSRHSNDHLDVVPAHRMRPGSQTRPGWVWPSRCEISSALPDGSRLREFPF